MKKEIYFAGGCFWGTEHFLKQINGVLSTKVGYANGNCENPTYEQVCTDTTNFVETVKTIYDSDIVDIKLLIELYFKTIDPTSLNRQGGDEGTQYRTGIFYTDDIDIPIISNSIKRESSKYDKPILIEVKPLENFYAAEDYHQNYLSKNPKGYCHVDPSLFAFARKVNSKGEKKK